VVAYKTELKPGQLAEALEKDCYPNRNYHALYFGQIKGVYAEKDAKERMPT